MAFQNVSDCGNVLLQVLGGIALILIAYAGFAAVRAHRGGQVTALLAVIPISLMWLDSLSVGQSQIGDCDGIGLTGAASAALMRAGWLFFAAIVLCLLSAAMLDPLERRSGRVSLNPDSAFGPYLTTGRSDRG